MNIRYTRPLIIIALTTILTGHSSIIAQTQSFEWPIVQRCGREVHIPLINGHLLFSTAPDANSESSIPSVSNSTTTDTGHMPIRLLSVQGTYGGLPLHDSENEVLFFSRSVNHARLLNLVKRTGEINSFAIDESQLSWSDIEPLPLTDHYRVLAKDSLPSFYLLDITITDQIHIDSIMQIPDSTLLGNPNKWRYSLSPDGRYVNYGYVSNGFSIYSVDDKANVATFVSDPKNDSNYLSWSNDQHVLAYISSGSLFNNYILCYNG